MYQIPLFLCFFFNIELNYIEIPHLERQDGVEARDEQLMEALVPAIITIINFFFKLRCNVSYPVLIVIGLYCIHV